MKPEWWLAFCLSAACASANAGEQPLDKAFLEYLETFGDDQGEVFDPADLETVVQNSVKSPAPPAVNREQKAHD
ncbi:MAG: hypothetical protein Q7T36_15320 [Fluviicoccus sp.]|uniref:hypothetical protein n=1 Tax=Fluviicoccus sp. TaxID=2003552 RepID=UPI002717AEA9|nr:hypothetical protein [Fluviicoccus sp.]MDO8331835.1 hypothetical protein [Fluviicoccus sp.]